MTVRLAPVPFQASDTKFWWYHRTDRLTGEVRFAGPFDTKQQALASIAADAAQTEHAMPSPLTPPDFGEPFKRTAKVVPVPGLGTETLWVRPSFTATEEVDMLLDGTHPGDVTYGVRLQADLDAEHRVSTPMIEISWAELQAFRAILALRPR